MTPPYPRLTLPALGTRLVELARANDVDALRTYVMGAVEDTTMKVFPLHNTARGEQILGIEPPIAPQVRPGWLRRLNFYAGRSLSAGALEVEQNGLTGQIALAGQLIAPGIINGLTAALEQDAPPVDAPPGIATDLRLLCQRRRRYGHRREW